MFSLYIPSPNLQECTGKLSSVSGVRYLNCCYLSLALSAQDCANFMEQAKISNWGFIMPVKELNSSILFSLCATIIQLKGRSPCSRILSHKYSP